MRILKTALFLLAVLAITPNVALAEDETEEPFDVSRFTLASNVAGFMSRTHLSVMADKLSSLSFYRCASIPKLIQMFEDSYISTLQHMAQQIPGGGFDKEEAEKEMSSHFLYIRASDYQKIWNNTADKLVELTTADYYSETRAIEGLSRIFVNMDELIKILREFGPDADAERKAKMIRALRVIEDPDFSYMAKNMARGFCKEFSCSDKFDSFGEYDFVIQNYLWALEYPKYVPVAIKILEDLRTRADGAVAQLKATVEERANANAK